MKYIIGIDGGGTSTQAVLVNENCELICRVTAGSANINGVGELAVKSTFRTLLEELLKKSGLSASDISLITCGIAGISKENHYVYRIIISKIIDTTVLINSDIETTLTSAFHDSCGIVVNCGTGSFVAGIDETRTAAKVGGWGYLIGDEASGYYLGLEAIKHAVVEYEEGRNDIFTKLIMKRYEIEDFIEVKSKIYSNPKRTKMISSLAFDVIDLAENKNKLASTIVNSGLIQMKFQVKMLESKLNYVQNQVNVKLTGGLFLKNEFYRNRFIDIMGDKYSFTNLELSSEIGALVLGMKATGIEIDYHKLLHI